MQLHKISFENIEPIHHMAKRHECFLMIVNMKMVIMYVVKIYVIMINLNNMVIVQPQG